MHTLCSDKLTVIIDPAGAEITSVKSGDGVEFIWQARPEVWPRHAPVLFPIVGKLKNNTYFFDDKAYELGQHGFARDLRFILAEASAAHCTFELSSDLQSKKNYPFDFIFRIHYELNENILRTSYQVVNPSDKAIFFSVGAHPGFRCPLENQERFEDYYLEFSSSDLEITTLNDGLRKTGKEKLVLENGQLPLSKELFDKDALVFENSQISEISLKSHVSSHEIRMSCKNWPYFGIWSKKGCSEFVCLEPWFGVADREDTNQQFEQKQGIIELPAGKAFECSFSVKFV